MHTAQRYAIMSSLKQTRFHKLTLLRMPKQIVGRRIKIFLRLKADGKIVVLVTSVASFAKVLYVNKS